MESEVWVGITLYVHWPRELLALETVVSAVEAPETLQPRVQVTGTEDTMFKMQIELY